MTFEALMPAGRRGRVDADLFKAAVEATKGFAENPEGWLVLGGTTGSGKTHLAAAIVNEIVERGEPAKYVSALGLPDLIRNERFEDDDGAEGGSFASLMDAPVLVLDDLGAQQASNWIDSKVDQLLTHRFNGRMPTVLVLAKAVSELPERVALKLDDPGFSRLFELSGGEDSRTNLPKQMLDRMTFEAFDPDGAAPSDAERQALRDALAAAKGFAENSENWLYLHGGPGSGKTHLALAIANEQIKKGTHVSYWPLPDLLDHLRQANSNSSDATFYSAFDAVRNSELLIIDDFSPSSGTDWALEKLHQLIAFRHERRLPTVIAGPPLVEFPNDEFSHGRWRNKHQWNSVLSRLDDNDVVTRRIMGAPDYRKLTVKPRSGR